MMIKKFKNLPIQNRASLVYLIANVITKGIGIITVPVFTRLMSSYDVGLTTTYSSWNSILYSIATLSLCTGSLNVAMMDFKENRDKYESACLFLSTISCSMFFILFIIFKDYITILTNLPFSVCFIMFVSFIFTPALDMWYVRQRYEYNYKATAVVSIISVVLTTIMSIVTVVIAKNYSYNHLGEVKIISQVGLMILFSSVFYFMIFFKGKSFIDKNIWSYSIKLSIPLIFHSLAKNVLDISDRIMISSLCGQSQAGIYGTIYVLSTMSLIIWSAINTSIIPYMFECLKNNALYQLRKLVNQTLLLFGIIAIAMTLIAPEIIMILTTQEYYEAIYLVPPISAGIYLTALYNIYGNLLMYKKKTAYIMMATVVSASLNVILNYILINQFGYIAAAYTTLFSFIMLSILQYSMHKLVYKEKVLDDVYLFIFSIFVVIACLLTIVLYNNTLVRYIVITMICLFLYVKRGMIIKIINKKQ